MYQACYLITYIGYVTTLAFFPNLHVLWHPLVLGMAFGNARPFQKWQATRSSAFGTFPDLGLPYLTATVSTN